MPGHYAAQALVDPHPALKAVSPQAPMADNWLGGDMHHNGALFLAHAFNFIIGFGRPRTGPGQQGGPRFDHGMNDDYEFFLEMGALPNAQKYMKNENRFAMPDINHTFQRGHRIMLQIQNIWFPLVDRNPQKFLNIYQA